jgi:hypothetical protein
MQATDALEHIRRHPDLYLPGGRLDPSDLATRIAYDALTLGATRAMTAHQNHWWAVAADVDWLDSAPVNRTQLFQRIVPFPRAGENSMRSEALIGALADHIVVWGPTGADLIKGNDADLDSVRGMLKDPVWVRVVAFRFEPARLKNPALRAVAAP